MDNWPVYYRAAARSLVQIMSFYNVASNFPQVYINEKVMAPGCLKKSYKITQTNKQTNKYMYVCRTGSHFHIKTTKHDNEDFF